MPPRPWPKAVPLLVLAGLCAYANCYPQTLVFDDDAWIGDHPYLEQPLDYFKSMEGRPLLAASNLALASGTRPAQDFLRRYAAASGTHADAHWLVMDAVGYLPPPGKRPLFGRTDQLGRLDDWLDLVVRDAALS